MTTKTETATHTPGPWRIGDAGHTIFGAPNGQPSPVTIAKLHLHLTPERQANARLIAAAPALRAELDAAALALLDDDFSVRNRTARSIRALLATIDGQAEPRS